MHAVSTAYKLKKRALWLSFYYKRLFSLLIARRRTPRGHGAKKPSQHEMAFYLLHILKNAPIGLKIIDSRADGHYNHKGDKNVGRNVEGVDIEALVKYGV